jgi:inosose dehydratase
MSLSFSRRHFILGLGAAGLCARTSLASALEFRSAAGRIRFGYAAITWTGNDLQAIKEISELGFPGIQLRSNILKEFGEKPEALRVLLQQNKLEMVALSSGGVSINPATEAEELTRHVNNAKFVRAVGGHYLQLTDSARPKDRTPQSSDFKELGQRLTEIGKRAHDIGVAVGYHNHMNALGESPDEVDQILKATDPRYVKLELDIAHYQQGGGDPARAIRKYRDRLLFLHIKDVESLPSDDKSKRNYRFVELGRGRVDLPAVFRALKDVKFKGWAVVELDEVPDKSRTPKECAQISLKYLEDKLGVKAL